ncbi:MAG: GntR family transcriptional regulator [Coriobacteriales bacterium]|jgi:DNA-binding transcriptional regulator YhcF (GntR family)|nr:GntR family transcriptional regulator [Coriobacteriales bacterium]
MDWRFTTDRPIYMQIVEHIQLGILSGIYAPGTNMPSVRVLALEAEVNPNTMQKALAELEAQGLLSTMRTSGRTVCADEGRISDLRQKMAQTFIKQYFASMSSLGITQDIAAKMLTTCKNENNSKEEDE